MKVEGIFNGNHLLLVSLYWMRQRLFKTYHNRKGRVVSSDRFTSSILNLLHYNTQGWGREREMRKQEWNKTWGERK